MLGLPTRWQRLAWTLLVIAILCSAVHAAKKALDEKDLGEAIALGNRFKKHNDFLEDGLKAYKIQMSSAMAMDGMSKYLTVLTDWTTVAGAAADAKRQLKPFTLDDAKQVPLNGLVHVIVEIHARGLIPTNRINGKYGNGKAHLVLQFGEAIVQPLDNKLLSETSSTFYYGWNYTVLTFGNMGWVFGGPAGWRDKKFVMTFSYQLADEQREKRARAILIDSNSGQDKVDIDFARLR